LLKEASKSKQEEKSKTGYQITQSLLFPIKTKKKTRIPRSRMNEEEEEVKTKRWTSAALLIFARMCEKQMSQRTPQLLRDDRPVGYMSLSPVLRIRCRRSLCGAVL